MSASWCMCCASTSAACAQQPLSMLNDNDEVDINADVNS